MSEVGQERRIRTLCNISASLPEADLVRSGHRVAPLGADCVAKVESCGLETFSENTTRELIADSYTLNRVTEVACSFSVKR
jgi:hypothetical protein